jgi:arsenite methyltransferase
MAHRPESGESFSQVETQREGIMFEGLHSALGKVSGCCSPAMNSGLPVVSDCCSPSFHGQLGELLRQYNVNDYAASVKVFAVRS